MEGFAVEIAIKKYTYMLTDAHAIYNQEITRLRTDYQEMHDVIYHYESRIKKLVATVVRLERMVVEQNQYFHSTLRLSEDYVSSKADAKLNLSELIRK